VKDYQFDATPDVGIYVIPPNAIGFAGLDEFAERVGVKPIAIPKPAGHPHMILQGQRGQYDVFALLQAFLDAAQNRTSGEQK
jgi:hypothetical protein